MSKPKILVQLDPDPHASVFDAVVAIDSEVDQLLQYHSVSLEEITGLVHGAMFTRGPEDLRSTAIFIGGSDVAAGEVMLEKVLGTFFGPIRVSVMLDASGANTTAAAAVVAAGRHVDLSQTTAMVLAATGPVGQRAARLLAGAGSKVFVGSRKQSRADQAVEQLSKAVDGASLEAFETSDVSTVSDKLQTCDLVIAAGAAGIQLLSAEQLTSSNLKVAIDLNAVPPVGIEGVSITDKAKDVEGVTCYGAIGVGGTKMKIHKAAIRSLFETNDRVLDIDAIYELGMKLE